MGATTSRVARFVAAKEWGADVQTQRKYADGAYWFTTAGHGGTVVTLDQFTPEAQEALRESGLTSFVVVQTNGRRTKLYYSGEYYPDKLLAWAAQNGYQVVHVAVGEEDCAYADLFTANDKLREAANVKLGGTQSREDVVRETKSWNPDFYTRLTGETVAVEESHVLKRRKFEADNADNYVTKAAWGDWHDDVPKGYVGVTATRKSDGDEKRFLVPESEYDSRNGSFVVDTSRHRAWLTAVK